VGINRLGQHFHADSCCSGRRWWRCFLASGPLPPWWQVGLNHRRRLVLQSPGTHRLWDPVWRLRWPASFSGPANAVIGPTWGNFTGFCQLPPGLFPVDAGLQRQRLVVGGRRRCCPAADPGGHPAVLAGGIALWMVVRRQQSPRAGHGPGGAGDWLGWLLVTPTCLMPIFSDENSRRFHGWRNFGQYKSEMPSKASSLGVLKAALWASPLLVLRELVSRPLETCCRPYLAGPGAAA